MTNEELLFAIDKLDNLRAEAEYNSANLYAIELLSQYNEDNDIILKSNILTILGIVNSYLGNYNQSISFFEEALEINENKNNEKGISRNLGNLGVVYERMSEYSKALPLLLRAYEVNQILNNKIGMAINLSNIGNIYSNIAVYDKSIDYFSLALQINEEIQNKNGIAINLMNIGIVHYFLKEFEKALEYYKKVLNIHFEENDREGLAKTYCNLGIVYTELHDYEQALESYNKALEINNSTGNKQEIANDIGNVGIVFKELKEFSKAIEHFVCALNFYKELQDRTGLTNILFQLGSVYFLQNKFNEALETIQKCILIAEEIQNKQALIECFRLLSDIYEKMDDPKESLRYFKKFFEMKEEIHSENTQKKALHFDQQRKMEDDEKARQLKLARFQEQEKLLHNILPINIADRILQQENFIADHFESVSVLFMDLVGFTPLSSIAPPKQLVYILDTIFQKADEVVERFGLEKIKTIGDGYLAVANVTKTLVNHQKSTALAALELLKTMKEFNVAISSDLGNTDWSKDMKEIQVRIGIHTGEVVAGVISKKKMTFDLWGDAVNVASRMESNSEPWKIHISDAFAKAIVPYPEFSLISRGEITIKGKGKMNTYWLEKGE